MWRICCLQGNPEGRPQRLRLLIRLGGGRPQLGSAVHPSRGADKLGGGPSVPWVTSETLPRAIPEVAPLSEVGFPKLHKGFPAPVCPSGPCFPTVEETQAHPKGPCPEGTLYSTVGEPEAQRGNLTHLRSHSRDGRTTTPAQRSGPPSPAHHPRSSPPPGSRTNPGQRSPDSVMSKGWGRWSPRPSPGRGHRT